MKYPHLISSKFGFKETYSKLTHVNRYLVHLNVENLHEPSAKFEVVYFEFVAEGGWKAAMDYTKHIVMTINNNNEDYNVLLKSIKLCNALPYCDSDYLNSIR